MKQILENQNQLDENLFSKTPKWPETTKKIAKKITEKLGENAVNKKIRKSPKICESRIQNTPSESSSLSSINSSLGDFY